MKTWIKRSLIGLATIATLGAFTACGAHRHGHAEWSPERLVELRGRVLEQAGRKLDLNEAQKQKLAVLADEALASRTALRGTTTDPRAELKALIASNNFDRAAALALISGKSQIVQSQAPKLIAAMGDFYDSLSAAQQQQLREYMDKRGGRWGRG